MQGKGFIAQLHFQQYFLLLCCHVPSGFLLCSLSGFVIRGEREWTNREREEEKKKKQRESRWWISAPTGPIDANELGSSSTAFCSHKQDITSVGAELHWEKLESRGQSEVHGCSSWARWRRWSGKALDWWGPSWCWSEFLQSVALH